MALPMRPRSDSAATRARLLDAAERLFAEQGIGAVSLRQINAAIGARNVSAAAAHDRFVRDLVDYAVGGLSAPITR